MCCAQFCCPQRIHTMENLSELLREGRGEDTHTLRDDRLTEEVGHLSMAGLTVVWCHRSVPFIL